MENDNRYMPECLKKFVKSYPAMRREARLNIVSGSDSATSNSLIRVQLPTGGLVDLSTFRLQGTVAISTSYPGDVTGSLTACTLAPTHQAVKRFNAIVGGVNIGSSCNEYGQFAEIYKRAGLSNEWNDSNVLSNQNLGVPAGGSTKDGVGFREWSYFPNSICQVNGTGILDTSIVGSSVLEVQFDLDSALMKFDNATVASASISNLQAYCNVVELANGADYARAQQSLLQGGEIMKMVCPNVQSTNQVNNNTNLFNVSSESVDHLVAAGYDNARNALSNQRFQATPIDNAAPEEADAANLTHFFQMGSNSIPQYGMTNNAYVGEISSANALGKDSPYNYNQLFLDPEAKASVSKLNYLTDNYIIIHDLSLEGRGALHKSRVLSGTPTEAGNSIVRFQSNGHSTSRQTWHLGAVCSGVISVKAGGQVAYQQ
jgi:hypothetical protein